MKRIVVIGVMAASLAGCGTMLDGQFANRLARTADGEKVYVVSLWTKLFGVATEIDKRDADALRPAAAASAPR